MADERSYLNGVTFLIVDDNNFMRAIVRRILTSFGAADVREAGDGTDALKILEDFRPDIIITDWDMEPMDGLDLVMAVRRGADSANPFVPIIMISAHARRAQITKARDTGINEYLLKPLSAKALMSRIQAVIERPRQFVRAQMYFGPDRRRQNLKFDGPDRRGAPQGPKPPPPPPDQKMEQEQIDKLFNPDEA